MGSETSNDFSDPWGSWSLGGGYDLFPLSFLSVGAEGRWRELSLGGSDGLELAIGMAVHLGGSSPPVPRLPPPSTAPSPVVHDAPPPLAVDSPTAPLTLADSVIATATAAMGRPYEYGGTGENGEGFDCSGLIQYAYAKHGIVLPRRSTDQARQGTKVTESSSDYGRETCSPFPIVADQSRTWDCTLDRAGLSIARPKGSRSAR